MTTPLHVLLVEDSEADARLIIEALRQGGFAPVFARVQTAATMRGALLEREWDIVLGDYAMPGFDGLAALALVRESGRDVPFIMIPGTIGEEQAVAAIKLGATDYLLKDRLARLGPAVRQAVEGGRLRRESATTGAELRLFRALMEQSSDGLEIIDPATGRFIDVNETECAALGYSRAELLRMGVPDIDLQVKAAGWPKIAETVRQAGVLHGEGRHQRKDGSSFPIEFSGRWVRLDRDYIVAVVRDITKRKRLEEGLKVSEARYRTTLENIMEGCQLISFDWHYLYLNNAAARHNRRPNAELLGRKLTEMWPGIEASPVFALLRRCMDERIALHDEIEFTFLDGAKGWFDVRSQPVPEGIFVLSIDISERKQAESALRTSESSLLMAQRVAHLGNWDLDLANLENLNVNPLRWSDELFRLFGYKPGEVEVTNELFFRHVHPEDREKITAAVAETLRTGRTYSIDHRIIRPDGTERVIHEQADIIRDGQGRPVRMVGTSQDVTERWRAEESLRRSEERFRRLIENASDMIAVIDQAGIIQFQSPSTPRLLGYAVEEMVGRPTAEFIHPDDRAKVGESIQRGLRGQEKPAALDFRIRHRDGSWRVLQSLGKGMTGPDGERLLVVNSRDVTDGRTLEEQLRQAQKMEAIGQLAAGVAHDFNNLLTVIKGHLGLLQVKGQVTPDIAGSVQQIGEAANRASNLTRQLLTFSRQQVMQPADHNLNGLVANVGKMLRRLLSEDIEMVIDCAPEPLPIRADEGMVEQVLLNLVVNARDAMPKGGALRVTTAAANLGEAAARLIPGAHAGSFAVLSVSDTGIGISPAILPHIFEPFFTTKGVGKGTGLGLATVYGVMQQHGGWVAVESVVDRGTSFRAYFPRVAPAKPATMPTALSAVRGGHETILFVEDEPAVRLLGEQALTGLGYRVIVAVHGMEALQIWQARQHEIDLLLTDLVMPGGVNGRELAERLTADLPALKVVYMSGYSHDVAGRDLPLKEGRNFLPKPFDVVHLAQILRHNLDQPADAARS